MSFLVDDDQLATLEVAFALIDECDEPTSATTTSFSATDTFNEMPDVSFDALASSDGLLLPAFATTPPSASVLPPSAPAPLATRKKPAPPQPKKVRSNAGAVARHRERKKADTQQLRAEAMVLEATLTQLQEARKARTHALLRLLDQQLVVSNGKAGSENGDSVTTTTTTQAITPTVVSAWLGHAAYQAQGRFRAEALNVKLKDAVAHQLQVIQSLESLLGKRTAMQGLELLLDAQKEDVHTAHVLAQEDRVFHELRDGLKQMYAVAGALFDAKSWTEPLDSVSCSTQVKHDAGMGGAYVEVRSNTPLFVTFQLPAKVMWDRMFCGYTCNKDASYHVQKHVITELSYQKCYTMFINGPDGQRVELRGVSYVERVDEPSRMVWLWRSLLVTPDGSGLRFMEKGWTVSENIGKSSSSSSSRRHLSRPASVYRTCYQASCDSPGAVSMRDARGSALIETVLRTLGSRTRAHQQYQQNMLLDEFAGPQLQTPMLGIVA